MRFPIRRRKNLLSQVEFRLAAKSDRDPSRRNPR